MPTFKLLNFTPMFAHAPSGSMMLFGQLHLVSVPLALLSAVLLAWPDRQTLTWWIACLSLALALPVLVVLPSLPSLLGSDAAGAIALLLVSPSISALVLWALRHRQKR